MKHEHFQIFKVPGDNINSQELTVFLNSGNISPKSISVDKYYNNQKLILIGYVKETARAIHAAAKPINQYELIEKDIDISFRGLSGIGELIETEVAQRGGVICQDIEYMGEQVKLTFLVSK